MNLGIILAGMLTISQPQFENRSLNDFTTELGFGLTVEEQARINQAKEDQRKIRIFEKTIADIKRDYTPLEDDYELPDRTSYFSPREIRGVVLTYIDFDNNNDQMVVSIKESEHKKLIPICKLFFLNDKDGNLYGINQSFPGSINKNYRGNCISLVLNAIEEN